MRSTGPHRIRAPSDDRRCNGRRCRRLLLLHSPVRLPRSRQSVLSAVARSPYQRSETHAAVASFQNFQRRRSKRARGSRSGANRGGQRSAAVSTLPSFDDDDDDVPSAAANQKRTSVASAKFVEYARTGCPVRPDRISSSLSKGRSRIRVAYSQVRPSHSVRPAAAGLTGHDDRVNGIASRRTSVERGGQEGCGVAVRNCFSRSCAGRRRKYSGDRVRYALQLLPIVICTLVLVLYSYVNTVIVIVIVIVIRLRRSACVRVAKIGGVYSAGGQLIVQHKSGTPAARKKRNGLFRDPRYVVSKGPPVRGAAQRRQAEIRAR